VPVAALEQVGEGGADRQRDAVDVGQDHRPPVLGRLLEEAPGGAEAGVGEDRVDPPEALQRRGCQGLDLIPLGDVARDGDRPLGSAELGGERLELSARRAASTRRYSAAVARAVAAPMPLLAPVISRTGVSYWLAPIWRFWQRT